ncbi:DUF4387 domain-containing protein [Peribacillus psychrosaccharolyticus]|uniref:DUF4387 domain-containing protein n=1 Tax=Peribacillus psychrosaccharolyticus TaxID=1407 RepID=A0A974NP90_PERPY|nr:DUF4387 domain-containing protein [Peribacillus psychrosaccharolyticus]MEC2053948.1 DUF4387 domain-containing protein [Peribacillus psychrosaccharolyticus]MED3742438.1 DUF4387 domain-containing protein [Peribacillus psychrosaccharolyticus]QQT01398.1 DUF4387 domain-containing protein [Peribacillus psychrosaccharolyticus]
MRTLYELAKVLRSKNSGPFELTLDILFDSIENYQLVKDSGKISVKAICDLYNLSKEEVRHLVFYDQALGVKITILRDIPSGSIGDRDVYGAQQHAPLMNIRF